MNTAADSNPTKFSAKPISAEFPFESRYLDVHGSKMHYVDEGHGDPILLLHGNPTSSYLWRNIIPYLTPFGRVIAPDLIGMGKSDKPDLDYTFFDHSRYLEAFVEKLGLKNVTLVLHDWGSGLGFHYAMRNEANVKGIAFMEAMIKPMKWSVFSPSNQMGFRMFRTPGIGWFMISVMNVFLTRFFEEGIVRKLTRQELDQYQAPFKTIGSRKPIRQWPLEVPLDGQPAKTHEVIANYSRRLQESDLPKILFYANPGVIITSSEVEWAQQNLKNLRLVDAGEGAHFLQEDNPHLIGEELANWYRTLGVPEAVPVPEMAMAG